MLQVDPDQRISISGIKNHPAFSIGIPNNYIIPTPLPLPLLTDPVDTSNLHDSVLKNLQRIGYTNRDELLHDLSSNEHTMAKVFHFMLTNRTSLAQLPWDSAHQSYKINSNNISAMKSLTNISYDYSSEISESKFESDLFPNNEIQGLYTNNTNDTNNQNIANDTNQNRIQRKPINFGIREPVEYSLVKKPTWLLENSSQIEYQQEEEIHGFTITLIDIFGEIQKWVQQKRYKWFYPDDFRMICMTQSESYLSLDCDYGDDKRLFLLIRLERGTQSDFDQIVSELRSLFAGKYIDENEEDIDEGQEIDEDY